MSDAADPGASQAAAAAVQSAGSGDAKGVCEPCCKSRIKEIDDQTSKIAAIDDPIERNKEITKAYTEVAAQDPQDQWVKLASIVSAQGGCAMHKAKDFRTDYLPSWKDALDEKTGVSFSNNSYHALGDANKAIFTDIYPYAAYKAKYGWQNLKDCYAVEGKKIPPELEDSFDKMDQGKLRPAADGIAKFEQMKVVQPVYEQYSKTFWLMEHVASPGAQKLNWVKNVFSSGPDLPTNKNLYDIPLSTSCAEGQETVPFVGSLANPKDRVGYYGALMNKLSEQQAW